MTRRELIQMLGIDIEDDLTDDAKERLEGHLDDIMMVTNPDAAKTSFPVEDNQLCKISGWEHHEPNIYALRVHNLKGKNYE